MAVEVQYATGSAAGAARVVVAYGHVCPIGVGPSSPTHPQTPCRTSELHRAASSVTTDVKSIRVNHVGPCSQRYIPVSAAAVVPGIERNGGGSQGITRIRQKQD